MTKNLETYLRTKNMSKDQTLVRKLYCTKYLSSGRALLGDNQMVKDYDNYNYKKSRRKKLKREFHVSSMRSKPLILLFFYL